MLKGTTPDSTSKNWKKGFLGSRRTLNAKSKELSMPRSGRGGAGNTVDEVGGQGNLTGGGKEEEKRRGMGKGRKKRLYPHCWRP